MPPRPLLPLQADLVADKIIFDSLRASNAVATATSEETSDMVDLGGQGYSVAFDPLDGSSIVGANFAVGSIFGIWPGSKIIGSKGSEQVAAAYSVYGPRTLLMWAIPSPGGCGSRPQPQALLAKEGSLQCTDTCHSAPEAIADCLQWSPAAEKNSSAANSTACEHLLRRCPTGTTPPS
jgi:hypothetical protein